MKRDSGESFYDLGVGIAAKSSHFWSDPDFKDVYL